MTICPCRSPRFTGTRAACVPGESLDRQVGRLLEERSRLIADYRELLANDEERAAYDQMIALAHRVFPYVEGHKFYCEHWYTNLFFNKIRSFGAMLAEQGFFASAEDVFHLTHYELEAAIIDLMNAWSSGSEPRGPAHWPAIVAERKAAIAEWAPARNAAGARAHSGRHRRSCDRHAVGDHAREPRQLAVRRLGDRTATRCAALPPPPGWWKGSHAS